MINWLDVHNLLAPLVIFGGSSLVWWLLVKAGERSTARRRRLR